MGEEVIVLTDLTKKYGSFTAVDHICLSVGKGEIFGLLGPNGAGQSTTILMMLGLTEPTVENLVYTAALNGMMPERAQAKAKELMARVGLGEQTQKKTGKYSRGMRQRLGLADVLIKDPEIIILDEPTSGIDPAGVQEFISLIKQLSREEKLTVLFSSHNLDQVQKVCDNVGLFNRGKLVALINLSELEKEHRELTDIYNQYFMEGGL